jgi:hypothetical protein
VTLAYARGTGGAINLLQSPESGSDSVFVVPNSLREVEVASNLLLREDDPSDDPHAGFPDPPPAGPEEEAPPASEDADLADVVDEAEVAEGADA